MLCVLTGTLGNTLGGITCYWLGRAGKIEWVEKYLKIEKTDLERAQTWTNKWGAFAAFFSFLPFIGDVINVLLGFLRTNFWKVSLFMAIGKFARYFVWMIINYFLINEF
jgi:membrane protein YqaA with SNARE-associated domain